MQKKINMFLLFSHQLSPEQKTSARKKWGVTDIVAMPEPLRKIWSQIPPKPSGIGNDLSPIKHWLNDNGQAGDLALIQGDFGATYLMVTHTLTLGLIPIYATTNRQACEKIRPDGSIVMEHIFRFHRFRIYGQ